MGWVDLFVDFGNLWLAANHHVSLEGGRTQGKKIHENHDPGRYRHLPGSCEPAMHLAALEPERHTLPQSRKFGMAV